MRVWEANSHQKKAEKEIDWENGKEIQRLKEREREKVSSHENALVWNYLSFCVECLSLPENKP